MEINLSPSIACEAPLDFKIKSKLLSETFNLVGVKQFNRKVECEKKIKSRTRAGLNHLTKGAQFSKLPTALQAVRAPIAILGSGFLTKQDIECKDYKEQKVAVHDNIKKAIKDMSSFDSRITEKDQTLLLKLASYKKRDVLKETLSEYQRRGNFERVFPAPGTDSYFKYFNSQNNLNKLLYDFIYDSHKAEEEKCEEEGPCVKTNSLFNIGSEDFLSMNKNKHFIDLEAKLRPLKNRPDSAVNSIRYKGLSVNDSNMSTSSTYKPSESIGYVEKRKPKKTTEDILIDYFQGILDNINNQYLYAADKTAFVVNFEQLEDLRPGNKPVITSLNQSSGKSLL
jgi:hypothetical protein